MSEPYETQTAVRLTQSYATKPLLPVNPCLKQNDEYGSLKGNKVNNEKQGAKFNLGKTVQFKSAH